MGTRKNRRYDSEFKLQAAKMVVELGYSYNDAAKQLDTTSWSIRAWVKKFREDGTLLSARKSMPTADEELKRLRKELTQLKMENDILKKAAVYFASQSE